MTDPTAKGYIASLSAEEMKAAVLEVYPLSYDSFSPLYGWRVWSRPVSCPYATARLGMDIDRDQAWADAFSKLPAKAAPEPNRREETFPDCIHCGHPGSAHDEEFGNCGHLGLTETGHDICECPGYEEVDVSAKAAPESEDEAFERFARTKNYDLQHGAFRAYVDDVTFSAWEAWHARARLSAGGK